MSLRIQYHEDAGSWWADSVDVPGFTAVAESLPELRPLARIGVGHFLGKQVPSDQSSEGA